MAEEIKADYTTGLTLYACRFLAPDSNVMLSNPATNEAWGTGGRDADDYDLPMTEEGGSGHYTGDFAFGGTIAAGTYHVVVYNQAGVNPADADKPLYEGPIYWDGSAEINNFTIQTTVNAILIDTGTTINDLLLRILRSLGLHR